MTTMSTHGLYNIDLLCMSQTQIYSILRNRTLKIHVHVVEAHL